MSDTSHSQPKVVSAIKEYLAPLLLSIVGLFIWRDISEMRADVKLLLVQQSVDRVKIENMEGDIAMLKGSVYQNSNQKIVNYSYKTQPAKKEDEIEIQ
jgi:hypothetical protein